MKKLFSLLALSAACLSVSAEETITWGYYTGNNMSDLGGLGVTNTATYWASISVPNSTELSGATIQAVNVPLASIAHMSDVYIFVANSNMNVLYKQDVEMSQLTGNSFNTIVLDEPQTIDQKLFVGYSFGISSATTTDDKYPVMLAGTTQSSCTYLAYASYGTADVPAKSSFQDVGGQYGVLGMNLELANVNIADYDVTFKSFTNAYTAVNSTKTFKLPLSFTGKKAVQNIEYVLTVNGESETRLANVEIAAGIGKTGSVNIDITSPAEIGKYPVTMAITKVNGEANASADKVITTNFENVSRMATRRSVVEEFTGTGCGYCPRGMAGMKLLRETYPDTFIGIGIHAYNSTDPMYPNPSYGISFSSAPSCKIDRKSAAIDPYYGSGSSICDDFENYNAQFAEVEVDLTATWNPESDFDENAIGVDLTATTTAIKAGTYKIAFVLVADSLIGTTSAWKQSNYYSTSPMSGDPYLDPFCAGGQFGTSKFFYPFDDVMIASSYSGSTNKAPALGALAADESKVTQYTVALPTKATLINAIKASIDKVYGIAIVFNSGNKVANAYKVKVVAPEEQAIGQVKAEANAPVVRYSLDGKTMGEGQKGLTIIRLSDGSVKKQLLR